MRNFSLIGLLLAVAIVGWMAKGMLAPAVSHDPNDKTTIEYWVVHNDERATMLAWCQRNPQQQDSGECQLATAAQMRIDTEGQSGGSQPSSSGGSNRSSNNGGGNNGVDQGSAGANDQLQAQQDQNIVDQPGQN
jgi:uncharacterized membrane protein YgcG